MERRYWTGRVRGPDRSGRARGAPARRVTTTEAADPAARRRMAAWAAELAADPGVVYLDTETTGLGGDAEVVDVAVVAGDGRVLLDTLVRPLGRIPADASRIHGIYAEDVARAPCWPEIHGLLAAALRDRSVVVYNASFDRKIVGQVCARHGLPEPGGGWHCAMRAYAAFRAEASGGRGGYRPHKLERAVVAFGGAPGGHRALGDALACRAVVLGMAAALDEDEPDDELVVPF